MKIVFDDAENADRLTALNEDDSTTTENTLNLINNASGQESDDDEQPEELTSAVAAKNFIEQDRQRQSVIETYLP